MTYRPVLFAGVSSSGTPHRGSAVRAVLQPAAGGQLVDSAKLAPSAGAVRASSPFSRVPGRVVVQTAGPAPVRWNGRPRVAGVARQPARTEGKEGLPSRG